MLRDRFERLLRVEAAPQHERGAEREPELKWAKPHEWNIGAAIMVVWRACSGIFESSAAGAPSSLGLPRSAPFGVPVVPDVSITTRTFSAGGSSSEGSPRR